MRDIYGIVESRMAEARETLKRQLFDSESLQLPIEEVIRRENAALAELLDHPEKYSWR